ncbi:MAG TPA: hypothetical protein VMB25_03840, partial [Bryobacteraceae bacterium]|nr:hypothetical protein [Bryobacteraceae bacterium]
IGVSLLMRNVLLIPITMVLCIAVISCLPSSSNIVSARAVGPEYTAILSRRDSGAMSKGSTLVSVKANGVPDDATHGAIVLEITGDWPVEMKWADPRSLSVSCQECTPQNVNFEAVKAGDVTITYDKGLTVQ